MDGAAAPPVRGHGHGKSNPASPRPIKVPRKVSPERRFVGFHLPNSTGPTAPVPETRPSERVRAAPFVHPCVETATTRLHAKYQDVDFCVALDNVLAAVRAALEHQLGSLHLWDLRERFAAAVERKVLGILSPDGTTRRTRCVVRRHAGRSLAAVELVCAQRLQSVAAPLQSAEEFVVDLRGHLCILTGSDASAAGYVHSCSKLPPKRLLSVFAPPDPSPDEEVPRGERTPTSDGDDLSRSLSSLSAFSI